MTARIVTFYGFRRGTGRTLAVANLSWILASAGKRVLVMDWDLKSPHLAHYFRRFLTDPELKSTDGLIDYFRDLQLSVASVETEQPLSWYEERADITPYIASVDMRFSDSGAIDMVSTGRQSSTYSTRLATFSWNDFYGRFNGGLFLDATRRKLRDTSDYDYVLIDSEPGMDAAAAVCTVQMPDDLVVCFTPQDDPEAAGEALRSILAQRGDRELRVFPVPMRVPAPTTWKRQRAPWMKTFDGLPGHLGSKDRTSYWREVSFQEFPEYVAQRTLATLNDEPGSKRSLLTASETLTRYLTGGSVTSLGSLVPNTPRAKSAPPGSANVFISYSRDDDRFKEELVSMLRPLVRNGPIVPWDDSMIQPGDLWKEEIRKALNSAQVAVLLVSRHFLESEFITTDELPPLLLAAKTRGLAILWVLVGACLYDEVPSLAQFQAAHDPAKPLERLGVSRRNESWVKICQRIKAAVLARQPAIVEHT